MSRMEPCAYCGEFLFFEEQKVGDIFTCEKCGEDNKICEQWYEDEGYVEFLEYVPK